MEDLQLVLFERSQDSFWCLLSHRSEASRANQQLLTAKHLRSNITMEQLRKPVTSAFANAEDVCSQTSIREDQQIMACYGKRSLWKGTISDY